MNSRRHRPGKAIEKLEDSCESEGRVAEGEASEGEIVGEVLDKPDVFEVSSQDLTAFVAGLEAQDLPFSFHVTVSKPTAYTEVETYGGVEWIAMQAEVEVFAVTCMATASLSGKRSTRLSATTKDTIGTLRYLFSERVDAVLLGDRALVRTDGQDG